MSFRHRNQGARVNAEHTRQSTVAETGLFAISRTWVALFGRSDSSTTGVGGFGNPSRTLRGGGSGARSSGGGGTALLKLSGLLALTIAALLALAASSASAAETHVFAASFGSEGSGAGQLNEPTGLAVDQQSGDVYVADTGNDRIDKFDLLVSFLLPAAALSTGAPA
jgi:DNA-binding beta-propeller fold protein YncE